METGTASQRCSWLLGEIPAYTTNDLRSDESVELGNLAFLQGDPGIWLPYRDNYTKRETNARTSILKQGKPYPILNLFFVLYQPTPRSFTTVMMPQLIPPYLMTYNNASTMTLILRNDTSRQGPC